MEQKYGVTGIAHIGIPTNDIEKTIEFYKRLGFQVLLETYNEKACEKVAFLQLQNYSIETFENHQAAMADGAYQHTSPWMSRILMRRMKRSAVKGTRSSRTGSKHCPFGITA